MKLTAAVLALAATVQAHCTYSKHHSPSLSCQDWALEDTFPALVSGNSATDKWQYVRKTTNYQSNGPVTDVTSSQIRCYQLAPGNEGAQTATVAAGSTVGFTADASVSHPGTLQFYMAKVPSGKTAATWDGDGAVWFKIFSQGPTIAASGLTWPSQGATKVTAKIPECLAPGDYLLRVEHIALHRWVQLDCAHKNSSCGGSMKLTSSIVLAARAARNSTSRESESINDMHLLLSC